jgi:Leucine-rich repeat (LRR) protein
MIMDYGIKGLTNLTDLYLSYNYMITTKGIKRLINLTSLNLDNNYKINSGIVGLERD